jgi:hydroxyacylglutathione hydrolase
MHIRQFEIKGLAQYGYLIASDGLAAVIDPIRDFDRYIDYAAERGVRITHVFETHIHADYASGAVALAEATGAELCLSAYDEGELYQYAMPHRALTDGESVRLGKLRIEVLHAAGHTPEHLSFLLYDTCRAAQEPLALFSGDFLFAGSAGRPDLLGDDAKLALAHSLYRSAHERIAHVPDGVLLYPGHGAGSLCGAGMSERPYSTVGYERATQALLQLDEEDFVQRILATVPPMPSYYPRMKRLNAAGARSYRDLAQPVGYTPETLLNRIQSGPLQILDTRRPEAFAGGHIRGAINIGAGGGQAMWAGWLLDPETAIVLVADGEQQMRESLLALRHVGLDRVTGYLEGGMPAWFAAGLPFDSIAQVSAEQASEAMAHSFVLDVRTNSEWNAGHVDAATHIMLGDLPERIDEVPRELPVLIVCGSGYRSSIAASLLAQHGYRDLSSMAGGMTAWRRREARTPATASAG